MEPRDSRTFDVFLSYARADETRVSVVQSALEAQGLQVWRDRGQIRPGDTWIKKLEAGLRESRCVVLFLSHNAAASEWVQREWNVALTVQMPIIPVRLDDSELPLLLKPVQCVDFPNAERLDAAVAEILSGVRGNLKQTPMTAAPQSANPSVLGPDVAILARMIVREGTAAARLETARWVAAGVGVAIAVGVVGGAIFLGGVETLWTAAMATGALIVAGIIGWAITAQVSSNRSEVMRLSTIKDGIELYCPNQPACTEFRVKLETILKRRAGIEGAAS